MKYYIYAIPPKNIDRCFSRNIIAVKNQGKMVLKKVQPGEKFILYAGAPELEFFGTGVIKSKYYFDNKTLNYLDEEKKRRVIYPYKVNVEFSVHNGKVKMKDVLQRLHFIKNKRKYGLYLRKVFFEISRKDYLLLSKEIRRSKQIDKFQHEASKKEFGNAFQDEIERIFNQLEPKNLENNYNKPGPDIIVEFDNNIKIIIQCKTSSQLKTYPSLQRLIDEYSRKVQKLHANTAILMLSGYKIPTRIEKNIFKIQKRDKVILWDRRTLNYYRDLVKKLGVYAKYQLFSDIGINVNFGEKIKVKAIKVRQGNYTFFVFKITPEFLLKSCRVLRHFKSDNSGRYQRILSLKRIRDEIPTFLNKEVAFLPSSIVCVSKNALHFHKGELTLISSYGSLWIMDGQHRLYAFTHIDDKKKLHNYELICSLFDGKQVNKVLQGEIFVDINSTSKKVPQALLLELTSSFDIINIAISTIMKLRDTNIFRGRIKMYNEHKEGLKQISFATFCTNQATKTLLDAKKSPLFERIASDQPNKAIQKGYKVFKLYFEIIAKHFSKEWNNPQKFILATDKGIRSLLRLLLICFKNKADGGVNKQYIEKIIKAFKKSKPHLTNSFLRGQYSGEAGAQRLSECWATGINEIQPGFYQEHAETKVNSIFIRQGERKKAEEFLTKNLHKLRGVVYAKLNYIDLSTLDYLERFLSRQVKDMKIIVDYIRERDKDSLKDKIREMNQGRYNIKILEVHKVQLTAEGQNIIAVSHGRWIGDNNYKIQLETDLKKDAIANKDHEKAIYTWIQPAAIVNFEDDWNTYLRLIQMKDRKVELIQ